MSCQSSLATAREHIALILTPQGQKHAEAFLTFGLIHLADVAGYLRAQKRPIMFSDDVPKGTITDLVISGRNAACHVKSGLNQAGAGNFIRMVFLEGRTGIKLDGGALVENPYSDDIAACFGGILLLLRRHLIRFIEEASPIIQELVNDNWKQTLPTN